MTGAEFSAYLVRLVMVEFDQHVGHHETTEDDVVQRANFLRGLTAAANNAAQTHVNLVELARQNIPTDEEADAAGAHEMEVRAEAMDGDHESALESVYGPDNDDREEF